ncbi:MAG: hypothetical protein M2R45_00933 [Verrucomicrobia subdivision 3 bacterium]|nr:hypothetical protein [Limisphaerales bacterium]MCS1414602.1 hypothetical protein [Limisphaerales bacterium]
MKIAIISLALVLSTLAGLGQAALPKSKSAPGAKTYIISPANGEMVGTTFTVKFGLQGMGIAPAGIKFDNTGHHHLLIDVEELPDLNKPLPATDNILHYGKGQTETTLTLKPGSHSLQLVLGDYLHIPHDKPVISRKIWITVK